MPNPDVEAGQNLAISLLTAEVAAHAEHDPLGVPDSELDALLDADHVIVQELWAASDGAKVAAVMALQMTAWLLVSDMAQMTGTTPERVLEEVVVRYRSLGSGPDGPVSP